MNKGISLGEKISYGFGAFTYAIETVLILDYLMLYCSDVLLIDIAWIGAFMMGIKILDCITDIVVFSFADRTNTKWGKYRVWMLNGIPMAIMLIVLFSKPAFLASETRKIVWIVVCYCILVPILETCLNGPYLAYNTTITDNTKDRLDLSNIRGLFEAGAALLISAVGVPLIMRFGGYKNPQGWRYMTYVIGLIIAVSTMICFWGTQERIQIDYRKPDGREMSFFQKFQYVKKCAPFWKLVGIIVFYMAQFYAGSSLFSYYCVYVLEHEDWLATLTSVGFGTQVMITVAIFYLGRKFEKRSILLTGGVLLVIANVLLCCASDYTTMVVYEAIWGVGNGIYNSMAFAMIPDVTDYVEWRSGLAVPGVITAFVNFALKLGGAFAIFMAGQTLAMTHYDATLLAQGAETIRAIRFSIPVISGTCIVITIVLALSLREISQEKIRMYKEKINS